MSRFLRGFFLNGGGGEFVRTPKGGGLARSGILLVRMSSRTFFAAITAVELVLGSVLLAGALYFGSRGHGELAVALSLKGAGFYVVAALSSGDLWSSFGGRTA